MIIIMNCRFDLHMHSFFSKDATSPPEDLIAAAITKGLQGIAITDHDTCEAHTYLRNRPLPENFLVVPGVEVSTSDGHLLSLGTTLPYLRGTSAKDVVQAVQAAGGLSVPAHPFDRWRAGIRASVLDTLDIEVIEVFNAAVTSRSYNKQALDYATRRGLRMLAGSDAHRASAVGVSSTVLEMDELSVPALLAALRKGGRPEGNYLTLREGIKKHFGNWFRKFNRRPPAPVRHLR